MRDIGEPRRQPCRLPEGGSIDRREPVGFEFDGSRLYGYRGDTLASALLANGYHLMGRSFKYHRPRGVLGFGAEEPNAIVQVGVGARTTPNLRATQVELIPGLQAESVNRWPSLRFDVGAAAGFFSGLLGAGFYYKTFMWPGSAWPLYERLIRRAAGLGRAPKLPDPAFYDKRNAHCDVLVVGGGPAGLEAARSAAASGARVIVADEHPEVGGSLRSSATTIGTQSGGDWAASVDRELREMADVTVLRRCTAFGYYDHNFVAMVEQCDANSGRSDGPRERVWRVRAKQVVIATGSHERPLTFVDNDRPGIMLASAVSGYIHQFAVLPGRRAVVAANNDSAYQTAFDLCDVGAEVSIVDSRGAGRLSERAHARGISTHCDAFVVRAYGRSRVRSVEIASAKHAHPSTVRLRCDLVAMSGGWNPSVHLHAQSGAKPIFDPIWATFMPGTAVQAERSAGACAGHFDLTEALDSGRRAGGEAARAAGIGVPPEGVRRPLAGAACYLSPPETEVSVRQASAYAKRGKAFIDFQNDTSANDIALAVEEGFESVEHVKRYTALGFGTDQGKLGNVVGAIALANELGWDPRDVGTTTYRPPYSPVTFGALAGADVGELFEPIRKTALHPWHEEHGAVFEPVGQWLRPWYYPRGEESMHHAVPRECRAVREAVGIMDASTLGKIDIRGTDAAEFLDRVYSNAWLKLPVGRSRYGLMLGEDGMVMDDGVTTRVDEHQYFMTTTTGGAAQVLSWLERWHQTEWPALDVFLTSVTDHWATIAVVGPRSRAVLATLAPEADLSNEAFPFMASQVHVTAGISARVVRISFSGELAYEINVPANVARHVWVAAFEAGRRFDITPYGTEAMHVLRAEKGYIIVGQDTDGSVTPVDLGMGRMCAKSRDFIGKRSLSRVDCLREDRKQLVGLLTEDPLRVIPEGSQLVAQPFTRLPVSMHGHVTSSYWSDATRGSIALALLSGGHHRHGEAVYAPLPSGELLPARVTPPVFYDPKGMRQDG